jgi:LmbE family N-acetylglucosaminyl deacetylase
VSLDVALFSPHLDDAVLSASVALTRSNTRLVTVFGGPPPEALTLTDWDRLTRATSSRDRFATRLAEDDAAMAVVGCGSWRLTFPEEQFRSEPLDQQALVDEIAPLLDGVTEVWAPAAVGGHTDHVATRDAVVAAAGAVGCENVVLYADVPYSLRFGWPSWVTGAPDPPYLDVGFWLDDELTRCGLDPAVLKPEVFALTARERELKQRAVRCYRSQLSALRMHPGDGLRWEPTMRFEVAWRLSRTG